MWSRKARPVATLIRPFPARSTFAVRRVSFDLRTTSPFLIALLKPHLQNPHELGGFAVSSWGPLTQGEPLLRERVRSALRAPRAAPSLPSTSPSPRASTSRPSPPSSTIIPQAPTQSSP